MARPRIEGVERPSCPEGHGGRIWLRGAARNERSGFERPRFTCVPADRTIARHNFTPDFSPRRHHHLPGVECDICERTFRRGEGMRQPRGNVFSLREIARVLVDAGGGKSYRRTSRAARDSIDRISWQPGRAGESSDEANLAMAFLDGFAPVIDAALAPTAWPTTLILDSVPFRDERRPDRVAEEREARRLPWPMNAQSIEAIRERYRDLGGARSAILVASGLDPGQRRPRPWRIRFAGADDEDSWAGFLEGLPGRPAWVVSDRAKSIGAAVARVWPRTLRIACEWHLAQNASTAFLADDLVSREHLELHPVGQLIMPAIASADAWDELWRLAREHRAINLLAWMDHNRDAMSLQHRLRSLTPTHSNRAAEAIGEVVSSTLDRRQTLFANRRRLDALLSLVRAEVAGEASEARYSRILRDHLTPTRGRVTVDWRSLQDRDHRSSITAAALDAAARRRETARTRVARVRAGTYLDARAAYAARRLELGLPPLPRGAAPNPKVASLTGKVVSDIPWLRADWHPTLNGAIDPSTVRAGSMVPAWWSCPYGPDHEWEAKPNDRARTGGGCPFCSGRLTARSESLEVMRPDLAEQWHPTRNTKGPWEVTWASGYEATWQCPVVRSHVYVARVSNRTDFSTGCPHCARLAGKGGRPRKQP